MILNSATLIAFLLWTAPAVDAKKKGKKGSQNARNGSGGKLGEDGRTYFVIPGEIRDGLLLLLAWELLILYWLTRHFNSVFLLTCFVNR